MMYYCQCSLDSFNIRIRSMTLNSKLHSTKAKFDKLHPQCRLTLQENIWTNGFPRNELQL
jgi:hypothetical protein